MIRLKSPAQIEAIAEAGAIVAEVLEMATEQAMPGRSTGELNEMAEAMIRDHPGAIPAFKGLYGFPATLCTSVNEEVVHGIPSSRRRLEAGDILSVDVGVKQGGLFADAAVTIPVGEVAPATERLLDVTRSALEVGVDAARPGTQLGDLGCAIQTHIEAAGFSVIRELVGHGVGEAPHEEPQVPNYGVRGRGFRMKAGLVIAIEPMVNAGRPEIRTLDDEWTVVTADGRLSAHFEHTVAVTVEGPQVLTRVASPARAGES
ncbi:type I methionyl aminopeptidase [Candidatus Palauibacter sp.]|uniref:type I methionyl aminopeptidase n=1 Tax=Candidatus Palauibacter sp. TaxID=3101350 RepID=UPI003AF30F82